jgi:hypothetical protein
VFVPAVRAFTEPRRRLIVLDRAEDVDDHADALGVPANGGGVQRGPARDRANRSRLVDRHRVGAMCQERAHDGVPPRSRGGDERRRPVGELHVRTRAASQERRCDGARAAVVCSSVRRREASGG